MLRATNSPGNCMVRSNLSPPPRGYPAWEVRRRCSSHARCGSPCTRTRGWPGTRHAPPVRGHLHGEVLRHGTLGNAWVTYRTAPPKIGMMITRRPIRTFEHFLHGVRYWLPKFTDPTRISSALLLTTLATATVFAPGPAGRTCRSMVRQVDRQHARRSKPGVQHAAIHRHQHQLGGAFRKDHAHLIRCGFGHTLNDALTCSSTAVFPVQSVTPPGTVTFVAGWSRNAEVVVGHFTVIGVADEVRVGRVQVGIGRGEIGVRATGILGVTQNRPLCSSASPDPATYS